jgi:hypothetical protein
MSREIVIAVAVTVALALAASAGASHWRTRRGDAPARTPERGQLRSGVWFATFLLGLILSLIVLHLAVTLTVRVWDNTMQPSSAAIRASGPDAPADASGDSVVNAMTAVGMVIALVTLVLSVGTSWLGTQQRELEAKLKAADEQMAGAERQRQLDAMRSHVLVCGMAAKRAALHWLQEQGTQLLALRFAEVSLDLDLLTVTDRDIRRKAFNALAALFDPDPWSKELGVIQAYTEECHRYLVADHALRSGDQGLLANGQLEREGVACRIFDPAEVDRVRCHA